MIQKIKRHAMVIVSLLIMGTPMLVPAAASANLSQNSITNKLCQGVNNSAGSGNSGTDCYTGSNGGSTSTLTKIAREVVNIFSIIVGIVAVIMIILGGFKYITSGGSSEKVGGAKNTLIYALIGLIIVALAQFIVHYVLTTTSNAVSS